VSLPAVLGAWHVGARNQTRTVSLVVQNPPVSDFVQHLNAEERIRRCWRCRGWLRHNRGMSGLQSRYGDAHVRCRGQCAGKARANAAMIMSGGYEVVEGVDAGAGWSARAMQAVTEAGPSKGAQAGLVEYLPASAAG
jgi:hypothetical protein